MPNPIHPTELVRVLEEDPDLGELLDPERFARAAEVAVARSFRLAPGELTALERSGRPLLGLLVLDGLLGNRVVIRERAHLELLGPGDLLRPWVGLGADVSTPVRVDWCAFTRARLAVLDSRFSLAIRDLPEVHEAIADRFVLRCRRLSFQLAVNAVVGMEERILLVLWHFGDRWGRVTREGIALSLPLTHRDIADVAGASRPTVSAALMELRRQGKIEPRPGGWLLCGAPPGRLSELHEQIAVPAGGSSRSTGEL